MEMKYGKKKKKHICNLIMKNGKEKSRCGLEFTSENCLKGTQTASQTSSLTETSKSNSIGRATS